MSSPSPHGHFQANPQSADEIARHALAIIYKQKLTVDEQEQISKETIQFWRENVNSGFLVYRKSMRVAEDSASLDWYDHAPGTARFQNARGQEYIDCLGGYGIYSVGRRNQMVVDAVKAQLDKQALHSQELLDPLRSYAAKLFSKITPGDGVLSHHFFVNSGAEAVEAGLKMAMLHTGRKHIVAAVGGFHGKTMGALATTSKNKFRAPFLSNLLNCTHVVFNDIKHLEQTFATARFTGNEIAGLILEPIQGEGGIHVGTGAYLRAARRLCDEYGACLIFDEVQTGMGRTGKWWGCEWSGVVPDLLCSGKGLGGGVVPVAVCAGKKEIWQKYIENPFILTTTFGGNPIACAAMIATVNFILEAKLLTAAHERGKQMIAGLRQLQKEFPGVIAEVRGRGLLIGVEFSTNEMGVEWAKHMFTRRVLTAGTLIEAKVIRVEPPLTITESEVTTVLGLARESLMEMETDTHRMASKL